MSVPARELVLTSFGDPYDPRTWSGTPHHILRALEQRGIRIHGLDYGPPQPAVEPPPGRLSHLVRRALGSSPRGPVDPRTAGPRALAAAYVTDQARSLGCPTVLHTGTFDLPSTDPAPSQVHYLFCDATWNLARCSSLH